jgi:hypothetical protein
MAAKNLAVRGDREQFMAQRIAFIGQQLASNPVEIDEFYGTSYRDKYEQIAGGRFDANGVRWRGATLCALIAHPSRPTRSYAYWREYGEMLRRRYDAGNVSAATESLKKR